MGANGGSLKFVVSMQCPNLLKKRSLNEEEQLWGCTAKRRCFGAEIQMVDCPMETSPSSVLTNEQQEQQMGVVRGRPALCCPRCLGGEPGHINHILGH